MGGGSGGSGGSRGGNGGSGSGGGGGGDVQSDHLNDVDIGNGDVCYGFDA